MDTVADVPVHIYIGMYIHKHTHICFVTLASRSFFLRKYKCVSQRPELELQWLLKLELALMMLNKHNLLHVMHQMFICTVDVLTLNLHKHFALSQ